MGSLHIELILSEFKISEAGKLKLFTNSNDAFKKEFNSDKNLNNQLKKKFLEFKPKYEEFISSDEFIEIRNLILENASKIRLISEKIIEYDFNFLDSFFASIFHMHINRTFISNQRLFEMVVYDYLDRYNNMKILKKTKTLT